jgi:single-strand DNA-binding protein
MNQIPIHTAGRIVSEPERTYRRDGMAVTRLHIEVLQRRLTAEGWRPEGVTCLECRAWAGLAEHIFASLGAGDRVVILGRLRQRPLSGGGTTYDVLLEDLGPSLVFTNAWLIPPDEAGGSGGVSVHTSTDSTAPADGEPAEHGATETSVAEKVVR